MTNTPTTSPCPADASEGAPPGPGTGCEPAAAPAPAAGPPVPYITPRSGESLVPRSWFIQRPAGLGVAYRHERPQDRDQHDVLWWRTAPPDTRARPQFSKVNPYRQRDVMLGMRCQVCGGQPSRTPHGILFFHKQAPDADLRWFPNSERTLHPPICLPCTQKALEYCPFVPNALAIRVKKPRLWGVLGTVFYPDRSGALHILPKEPECPYSDVKNRRWIVARQAIVEFDRATVVDIRDEFAAASLELPASLAS